MLKGVFKMEFKGIDVSKWQGEINWQSVQNTGINFAIIREGYGKKPPSQIDKKFKENIEGAKNAGINVGVYHYSYAESTGQGAGEAGCGKGRVGRTDRHCTRRGRQSQS